MLFESLQPLEFFPKAFFETSNFALRAKQIEGRTKLKRYGMARRVIFPHRQTKRYENPQPRMHSNTRSEATYLTADESTVAVESEEMES